jgi:hypothetical protein
MASVRADYDHQLDARFAAARGFVDAVVLPDETRAALTLALRTSLNNPGPHLGAFVLPPSAHVHPEPPQDAWRETLRAEADRP